MKKLLITSIIALFAMSCGSSKENTALENAITEQGYTNIENLTETSVKADDTKEVYYAYAQKDGKDYSLYITVSKEDKINIDATEDEYATFEKEELEKYKKDGIEIINVEVSAKTLDIRLVTKDSNFSMEKFNEIAPEISKSFKEKFENNAPFKVYLEIETENSYKFFSELNF